MVTRKKADPATDARRLSGAALEAWAFGWDAGLLPIAGFIKDVEAGLPAPEAPAKVIAAALREFFCHRDTDASLHEFARKLGLKRKQGKRGPTADELDHVSVACFEIAAREGDLIAAGKSPSKAESAAKREYAAAHKVSLRTVQAWWKSQGDGARVLIARAKAERQKRATKSR
jgi:hypothetical protein